MARTKLELPFRFSFAQEEQTIQRILTANGYHQTRMKNGESVWKKGMGLMKFVKTDFSNDKVLLSGWVQIGIGSFGGDEMQLTGAFLAPKTAEVMNVFQELKPAL